MRYRVISLGLLVALLVVSLGGASVRAQDNIQPLRVEVAVTGKLTSIAPMAIYSFDAVESLRMAVIFDAIETDMELTLVVLDQDQATTLAGATGPNVNGLIVEFPAQGTYYLGVQGEGGTFAQYRLLIQAAPALPINPFVAQSFLVAGESSVCTENVIVGRFTPNGDLNVCFSMELIDQPIEFKAEWWSPSGKIVVVEDATLDSGDNGVLYLTGVYYKDTPWETGWWQVHFVLDGELAKIQWVLVAE
ncbi:MAG: hypothetical protein JXA10_17180 [Anaerolineae bacterium]|nr:hypothetical protein [Anaerolineae bacterium]